MEDDRVRRLLLNEITFREVNERIEDLNRGFGEITGTMDIVCECSTITCLERIIIPMSDYERVRADPALFMVVNGHENLSVETVDHLDGYAVVRKFHPEGVALAAATHPRK